MLFATLFVYFLFSIFLFQRLKTVLYQILTRLNLTNHESNLTNHESNLTNHESLKCAEVIVIHSQLALEQPCQKPPALLLR